MVSQTVKRQVRLHLSLASFLRGEHVGPVSCIFSVTWLAGDIKEPTHLSKRVGHVVPGVVVYLSFHAWVGWVSEIKYGLIAAARGAFTS